MADGARDQRVNEGVSIADAEERARRLIEVQCRPNRLVLNGSVAILDRQLRDRYLVRRQERVHVLDCGQRLPELLVGIVDRELTAALVNRAVYAGNCRVCCIDLVEGANANLRSRVEIRRRDDQHRIVRTVVREARQPVEGEEELVVLRTFLQRNHGAKYRQRLTEFLEQ